jgi:hypothetical protein
MSTPELQRIDSNNFDPNTFDINLSTIDELDDIDDEEISELIQQFQSDPLIEKIFHDPQIDTLRENSDRLEGELKGLEEMSLREYVRRAESFINLHHDVQQCSDTLENMLTMLNGFNDDLSSLTLNLEKLMSDSKGYEVAIKNRKKIEIDASEFVGSLVIDEEFIKAVCEKEITEEYMEYIRAIFVKNSIIDEYRRDYPETRAFIELQPVLEKLRVKAVSRVRAFLMAKILALKKPNTNIQMMQQNVLLKYGQLFRFLNNYKLIANEILTKYADIVGNIYAGNFKYYLTSLSKMKLDVGKSELLGSPETAVSKNNASRASSPFLLGNRDVIFQKRKELGAIIPHFAIEKQQKFSIEELFQSLQMLLIDTVSTEIKFEQYFFGGSVLFQPLFGKIVDSYLEWLDTALNSCYDPVSVMIMMINVEEDKETLKTRIVQDLDPYLAKTKFKLAARLNLILDANIQSLKDAKIPQCTPTQYHAHFIMRRYSELLYSASALLEKLEGQDKLKTNAKLTLLRKQIIDLITRIAPMDRPHPNHIRQSVFYINNYSLVVSRLAEKNFETEDTKQFSELEKAQSARFVEDELLIYFNSLVHFTKQTTQMTSALDENPNAPKPNLNPDSVNSLIKEFEANWKQHLNKIRSDVFGYFSNFITGTEILKKVFTQLILYYKRFEETVKKLDRPLYDKLSQHFVPIPTLTYEMKDASINF